MMELFLKALSTQQRQCPLFATRCQNVINLTIGTVKEKTPLNIEFTFATKSDELRISWGRLDALCATNRDMTGVDKTRRTSEAGTDKGKHQSMCSHNCLGRDQSECHLFQPVKSHLEPFEDDRVPQWVKMGAQVPPRSLGGVPCDDGGGIHPLSSHAMPVMPCSVRCQACSSLLQACNAAQAVMNVPHFGRMSWGVMLMKRAGYVHACCRYRCERREL